MKKAILITGATSGVGKALAFELAKRGYSMALTGRRTDLLEMIQKEIKQVYPGQEVEIHALDVTAYETIPPVVREMAEALGGLDIVFANAGVALDGKVGQGQFENAITTIEVNLLGAMATVDAATAYFLERGSGHIVATSSVAAFRGLPGHSSYCASKAGLSTYLEALRTEVYQKNIDITVLHPGFIATPLNEMLPRRPFLIPAEKGAAIIARLIEKKAKSPTVPVFPWNLIRPLLRILPTGIIAKMK
ncbi:MAG: SDR family NAD(P)-dependent oxidoreductase [Deltaproteobacteria bacterium]|nr:SDR family NAD(P)-dependent oxidoreductase [Deltaproteobacteria bacterium]